MRFLVDESTGRRFNEFMIRAGYDSIFVGDIMRGISDEKVLSWAEKEHRILITDDKDFGELIFRLNRPSTGIVLLRTTTAEPLKKVRLITAVIKNQELEHRFTTITEDKIRIRKI